MSIQKKNFAGLQTFSISTLFSYFNAYQDSGFSEEEGFVISSLKEILNAGHSVRVRTDTDENTRTYELVYDAAAIAGLRELQETTRNKCHGVVVVLDSHLFKVTFDIKGREVTVYPGPPGPMGIKGEPGKNGVSYEEVKQRLIEEGYLPATIGLKVTDIDSAIPGPQEPAVEKDWSIHSLADVYPGKPAESSFRARVAEAWVAFPPTFKSPEVTEGSLHLNLAGFDFLSETLSEAMNDPTYSKVVQSETNLKEETLLKVVKIFSDNGKALVIPEIELTEIISISIDHDFTLKIVSGISGRDYSLEFSDSKKARNTLNRICKKYTSAKTI